VTRPSDTTGSRHPSFRNGSVVIGRTPAGDGTGATRADASMWRMFTMASSITDQTSILQAFASTSWLGLVWYVIIAIGLWKVFEKAGHAGWLAIIPIVNIVVLVRIAGWSGWMALLYLIPIVNIIFAIVNAFRIGKAFGKGGLFSFFMLWLLSGIGYLILGFGSARYNQRAISA